MKALRLILLNFDFIDNELTKNTIHYLNEEQKEILLNEAELWKFNGTGFKNKTRLQEYMIERGYINKKELIKKLSSESRRTNEETIIRLYKLFVKDTPLYIDRERLYKLMLLSSNLMFTPNEKICFTIMFENPYRQWSADEIAKEAKKNNLLKLNARRIEESLDRHLVGNSKTDALLSSEKKGTTKFYRINFTNFIYYIRYFDSL